MRMLISGRLLLAGALGVLAMTLAVPPVASAKVFFYALTRAGDLVRYDPDTDQVEVKRDVDQGYIGPRLEESKTRQQTRILDVAHQRIVTLSGGVAGPVLIDLQAKTAKEITLGPPDTVGRIRQLIYPRRASRFYVHWLRERPAPARPEVVLTAVGLDGQIFGTSPSLLSELDWPVYHPDGRHFYFFEGKRVVKLIDGETLGVMATYDLTPLARPEARGPGISDARDNRVLLAETTDATGGGPRPWTVFTTDLTLGSQSASQRIATGLDQHALRLLPDGQTVLLQEPRVPAETSGAGRLHFFDVRTGAKLGIVEFPASRGANLLGFHPDGRRLFIRVSDLDPVTTDLQPRLVIVDVVTRTVVRDRPFEDISVAVDFVDEPDGSAIKVTPTP